MIYVLDTNVISEIMKPRPNHETVSWIQDHNADCYTTSITIEELYYGANIMPKGKRRDSIREHIDAIVRECNTRTLDFDGFSGYLCGEIRAKSRAQGRAITLEDAMIAAICKRHDATLVTHNVKDFDYMDVKLLDPFDYNPPILAELRRREAEGAK